MDRVWVRGNPSRKVIEEFEVHYFYWKLETGLSHLNIKLKGRNYRIPVFILKAHDYEPVKKTEKEVQSRYHHRFLTIFHSLKILKGRPVVEFLTPAHVPMIFSDLPKRVRADFNPEDMSFEETWSFPIFVRMLRENCWKSVHEEELCDYNVTPGTVPEEARFDSSKIPFTIEVG